MTSSLTARAVRCLAALVAAVALLGCLCAVAGATGSVHTVSVGSDNQPQGVAVDSSTHTIYVADSHDASVSVIDGITDTVTATIGSGGSTPEGVAVDAATDRLYVANDFSSNVSVIDGASNTILARVPVGGQPIGVAVDPSTDEIYVTDTVNLSHNSVSVIDGASDTVIATLTVGDLPIAVAVDPSTHTAYVLNSDNWVSVIDGATHQVTASVHVGGPSTGLAVDPSTHKVYVANYSGNSISVIDGTTNHITATIPVAKPYAVAVDPVLHQLYVTSSYYETVSMIDEATGQLGATANVGSGPLNEAVNPATHKVYVANYYGGTVSMFSPPGVKLQDLSVGAGSEPTGVVYEPASDQMFVALGGADRVMAISSASTCGVTGACSAWTVPGFGSSLRFPESVGLLGGLVLASNFHAPASDAVSAAPGAPLPGSPTIFDAPGCAMPAGVAGTVTGGRGAVWVTCPGSGKLAKVSADGSVAPVVSALPLAGALPSGVTADPTTPGAVFVADARHDKLYIYTSPAVTPTAAQTASLEPGCAPAYVMQSQWAYGNHGDGWPTEVYVACPGTNDIERVPTTFGGAFKGAPVSFTAEGTPVPTRDYGLAVSGSTLIATGAGSSDAYIYTLGVTGASSGAVHVTSLPAGSIPDGVAIAGSEAYIADEGTGQISVIDPPAAPPVRHPARIAAAARARPGMPTRPAIAVGRQLALGEPLIAPRPGSARRSSARDVRHQPTADHRPGKDGR